MAYLADPSAALRVTDGLGLVGIIVKDCGYMAMLVGIDEAGYGPLLGPLVVSACWFEVPDGLLGENLWEVLGKSISDKKRKLLGRILIADSKKAKTKAAGLKHLERTTLAVMKGLGWQGRTVEELMGRLCPECLLRVREYQWYKEIGAHELGADKADVAIAAEVFVNDMAEKGMKVLDVRSICLDAGHYNRLIETVNNKANVLFSATARHIKEAWDSCPADKVLQVIVDRQGGRSHYGRVLLRMFEGVELVILKETEKNSSYELRDGDKIMRVHFVVRADSTHPAVALASMVSKYVRELLVENINRYFIGFKSDLRPTAGYWTDGLRFIGDLEKYLPEVRYDRDMLVRSR